MKKRIKLSKGYKFLGWYPRRDKKSLQHDLNAHIRTGNPRDDGDVPFWFKNKTRRDRRPITSHRKKGRTRRHRR